ncbi:hypothetical protein MBOVJF4428_00638 [Mycoplasmopsis agalactiae]|nr:BspA family leucine-rich repeat surface protein [Mycoplasmopsis agalactiae]CAL58718.1 Conserved hypothetical protein, DUF285 family [Mycoplasmopsis agalactiae PG2]MCE6078617.1 BspA family leucine-rich repeat surface protein [Mycoplasmopsis agalactiae]MCE6095002.1 BspA family leucine-rich repeat surface protein [Mycoplasmopsis agalactiae]MCE6114259.1 BspA family leucine-rich repeat surface protein [Mycoplasmopsis agalactiae]
MSEMFWATTKFNANIGKWDVSKVTSMYNMFSEAESFNQDISQWDVQQVKTMVGMFGEAKSFNQNISSWKVRSNTSYEKFTNESSVLKEDVKPKRFQKLSQK